MDQNKGSGQSHFSACEEWLRRNERRGLVGDADYAQQILRAALRVDADSAQIGTGRNNGPVAVLGGPGIEVGLIGLELAFERIDEPAVEGVDLYLGAASTFRTLKRICAASPIL